MIVVGIDGSESTAVARGTGRPVPEHLPAACSPVASRVIALMRTLATADGGGRPARPS